MSGVTVRLAVPIEAHGETLTELVLREPTGKDIRISGMPFRFHAEDGTIVAGRRRCIAIASLAAVPVLWTDLRRATGLRRWRWCWVFRCSGANLLNQAVVEAYFDLAHFWRDRAT